MKRVVILSTLALTLLVGCSQEEDVLAQQRTRMVSYLTSVHNPRLVSEEELEAGSELPFYSVSGETVYRYINQDDYYNPDRQNQPEVLPDSRVTVTLTSYVFTFANITTIPDGGITPSNISRITMSYFSNDPAFEEYFSIAGLTPGVWSFEPLTLDLLSADIIKGLRYALVGCRQGDRVEAYMTYNMAYGDKESMYFIPRQTPVALFFTVDRVD